MKSLKIILLTLGILCIATPAITQYAFATIGDEELCQDGTQDDAPGNVGTDTNDYDAQTFTPTESFTLSAIKASWWGFTDNAIATVYITETDAGKPDLNNILAQEDKNMSNLPLFDFSAPISNPFTCDPLGTNPEQVVEFSSPPFLNAGSTYALVIGYKSGVLSAGDLVGWPYDAPAPADPLYSAGFAYECNAPGACTALTPSTWDVVNSCTNCAYDFALFNNTVVFDDSGTIDDWLVNFLRDFLGLTTTFDYLIFGMGLITVLSLFLIFLRIPPIIVLGVDAMVVVAASISVLMGPTVTLVMVAVAGMAVVFRFTIGMSGSDG